MGRTLQGTNSESIAQQHPLLKLSLAAEASHTHLTAERKSSQVREETRARLLRAVQQTYEDVFERAQIAPPHMYQLRKSANQALDHTLAPLCDWMYLDQTLQLPAWLQLICKWVDRSKCSQLGCLAKHASSSYICTLCSCKASDQLWTVNN